MATTNRTTGLRDTHDIAVLNADVTTPDQTVVLPAETLQKTWEIQNLGTRPWRGRKLVRVDSEYVIARHGHIRKETLVTVVSQLTASSLLLPHRK